MASWGTTLSVHAKIAAYGQTAPRATAVVCAGKEITYSELNHQANRLAHCLHARGVGPDVLVGVCLERSIDLVVALLAIQKVGGAYLPLDPSFPQDRLAHI